MNKNRFRSFQGPVLLSRAIRWGERCFALIGIILVTYHTGFYLSPVVSPSMAPTLQGTSEEDADWVLVEKWSYRFREPSRWEVVTFPNEIGINVVKRIVGLPGETISLRDNQFRIDGAPLERPSALEGIRYLAYGNLHGDRSVDCEQGYYVVGDQSSDSEDSRFEGTVDPEKITGRAWLVVWPPSRFGAVAPVRKGVG